MSSLARIPWGLAAAVESRAVQRLRLRTRHPPLFVVGAARSGTTAIYLHLLNRWELGYFPNVARAHPRAPVTAAVVGMLAGRRYRPTYVHRYGQVDGPMAPSDGWEIFHRWFPRYDHRRPVDEAGLHALRTIVRLYEGLFRAPFSNKNNSNSLRVRHLDRLFPDALFVAVHRDLAPTVRSVLEARKTHGVPLGEWWSASPPQFLGRRFADPVEQAVHQTWGVDRFLRDSLGELPPDRWRSVAFEDACEDPSALEGWVESRYEAAGAPLRRRPGSPEGDLRPPRRREPDPALAARVTELIRELEADHGAGGRGAAAPGGPGGGPS